jgi:ABC-type polar amino acid transport system ATPase subunit
MARMKVPGRPGAEAEETSCETLAPSDAQIRWRATRAKISGGQKGQSRGD